MQAVIDRLPIINAGLLVMVMSGLATLAILFWRRRVFWLEELHGLVEELKEELPPIICRDILTQWDMERVDRRIERLESVVGWLEERANTDDNAPPSA